MKVYEDHSNTRSFKEISALGVNLNYIKLQTNYTDLKSQSMKKPNLNIKNFNYLPKIKSTYNFDNYTNTEPNNYFSSLSHKINKSKEKLKTLKIENLIEGLLKKSEKNKIRKYDFNSNTVGKIEEAKKSKQNNINTRNSPKESQKKISKITISSDNLYNIKEEIQPKKNLKIKKMSKIFSNSKQIILDSLNKKFYESIKPKILHYKKPEWDFKENKTLKSMENQPKITNSLNIIRNVKIKSPEIFNTINENDLSSFHEQKRTSNNVSRESANDNNENKEFKTKYEIESYKTINLKSKYNQVPIVSLKKNFKPLNYDGGYLSSRMSTDLQNGTLI
jgi:hypothetical protein